MFLYQNFNSFSYLLFPLCVLTYSLPAGQVAFYYFQNIQCERSPLYQEKTFWW